MVEVPDNLNITYRPDLDILYCRFVQPGTSAQLKNGYEKALKVAKEHQASFWLFDLRRRGPARSEDETWILDQFFPRLEAESKRQNFMAYLVSPSHYNHVREVLSLERLETYSPLTRIKLFDSEEQAFEWLTQNQPIKI
jgi:hypothetical protein